MDPKKLTARQQQIYDFICAEVSEKGYPPSVREIALGVGLSSPSTVHTHLQGPRGQGIHQEGPLKAARARDHGPGLRRGERVVRPRQRHAG